MNIIEFAIVQADRAKMSDQEAAKAIAAAKLVERPRKIPKAGVSICWVIDAREGAAGHGLARRGVVWHGKGANGAGSRQL